MIAEQSKIYDYNYYQSLPEGTVVELIDGQIVNMPPAPNFNHQLTSSFLHREISNYLRDKSCNVFHAPFDVYLVNETQDITESKNIVLKCTPMSRQKFSAD